MRIEKRLRALETKLRADPVILYFADGSSRPISGRRPFPFSLFADLCERAELSAKQLEQVELIKQCVAGKEPNGGHMVDVIRCMLHGGHGDPRYDESE